MLATDKQINYLQTLADKVERMHTAHPSLFPEVTYINWHTERFKGVSIEDASIRIEAYKTIIRNAKLLCKMLGFQKIISKNRYFH